MTPPRPPVAVDPHPTPDNLRPLHPPRPGDARVDYSGERPFLRVSLAEKVEGQEDAIRCLGEYVIEARDATKANTTAIDNLSEKFAGLASSFSTFREEHNNALADVAAAIIRRDAGDAVAAKQRAEADRERDQRIAAVKGGAGAGGLVGVVYAVSELLERLPSWAAASLGGCLLVAVAVVFLLRRLRRAP